MAYRGVTVGTPFGSPDSFSENVEAPPSIFENNLKVWVETKGGESNVVKDAGDRIATWFARSPTHGPDLTQGTAANKPKWLSSQFKGGKRAGVLFCAADLGGSPIWMDHPDDNFQGTFSGMTDVIWAFAFKAHNIAHNVSGHIYCQVTANASGQDYISFRFKNGSTGTGTPEVNYNQDNNEPVFADNLVTAAGFTENESEMEDETHIVIVVRSRTSLGQHNVYTFYNGPKQGNDLIDIKGANWGGRANELNGFDQENVGNAGGASKGFVCGAIAIVEYPYQGGGNPGPLQPLTGAESDPSHPVYKLFRYLRNNYK